MKKIISLTLALVLIIGTLCVFPASAAVKKPKTLKAANTSAGIKLSWSKVKGARYKVYRDKTLIVKSTAGVSYTDKKIGEGKTCTYRVKAYKGKNTIKTASVKATRLAKPEFYTDLFLAEGIKISWKPIKGATKYILYKESKGKFVSIKAVRKHSCIDTSVADKLTGSGRIKYKVRAYNSKSKTFSQFSDVYETIYYLRRPVITSTNFSPSDGRITVEWEPSYGRDLFYRVYKWMPESIDVEIVPEEKYVDEIKNPCKVSYGIVAINYDGISAMSDRATAYAIPQDSCFTDEDNNFNVNIKLNTKESYKYIGTLLNRLSDMKTKNPEIEYSTDIVKGEKVINLTANNYIEGIDVGEAQLKINLSKAAAKAIDSELNKAREYLGEDNPLTNHLETGVVLVNVTVE